MCSKRKLMCPKHKRLPSLKGSLHQSATLRNLWWLSTSSITEALFQRAALLRYMVSDDSQRPCSSTLSLVLEELSDILSLAESCLFVARIFGISSAGSGCLLTGFGSGDLTAIFSTGLSLLAGVGCIFSGLFSTAGSLPSTRLWVSEEADVTFIWGLGGTGGRAGGGGGGTIGLWGGSEDSAVLRFGAFGDSLGWVEWRLKILSAVENWRDGTNGLGQVGHSFFWDFGLQRAGIPP